MKIKKRKHIRTILLVVLIGIQEALVSTGLRADSYEVKEVVNEEKQIDTGVSGRLIEIEKVQDFSDDFFKEKMKKYQIPGGAVAVVQKGKVIFEKGYGYGYLIVDKDAFKNIIYSFFERFYRGERGRGTKSGGMGLGLAISREIIRQHHGEINITSEEIRGTKVEIKLINLVIHRNCV